MKNIIPILVVGVLGLSACQNNNSKPASVNDSAVVKTIDTAVSASKCFSYAKNRDTAFLSLNNAGNRITGTLSYQLFEKDRNAGTISGIVKGDTLLADYTFQSEGKTSVREVAWLIKNGNLVEGFGDVEQTNGKMKFKNPAALTFGEAMVFTKTACK